MKARLVIFGLGIATGRMGEEPKIPVVKSVAILAAGFGVGYSAAMGAQGPNDELKEATTDFIKTMKAIAVDAWLDVKQEMADAVKAEEETEVKEAEEVVDGEAEEVVTAIENGEGSEESDEELEKPDDEESDKDNDEKPETPQGETP